LNEYFARLLILSFLISLLLPLGLGGASDFTTYQTTAGFIALAICLLSLIIGLVLRFRKRGKVKGKAWLWNSLVMLVLAFSLVSTAQAF
jgi:amino acid transporter